MTPGTQFLWLPLTRLTAFFVAVVVVGTYFLRTVHPSPSRPNPDSSEKEAYEKRRKRMLREWGEVRSLVRPPKPQAEVRSPASPKPAPRPETDSIFDARCPMCGEADRLPRAIGDPVTFVEFHRTAFYADLPRAFAPLPCRSPVERKLNDLFSLPEVLLEGAVECLRRICPDPPKGIEELERQGIVERFLDDVGHTRAEPEAFTRFLGNVIEGEVDFFRPFRDATLIPEEFEERSVPDGADLIGEQGKILWRAAQRTYLSRFRGIGNRARELAYAPSRWAGVDYVVAPLVVAGTLYLSGLDRRFSAGPIRGRVELEAMRTILERWGDEGAEEIQIAAGLEVGWKSFPLRVLIATGLVGGRPELEFVGIGTGLGEVREVLSRSR